VTTLVLERAILGFAGESGNSSFDFFRDVLVDEGLTCNINQPRANQ